VEYREVLPVITNRLKSLLEHQANNFFLSN
jgi:hypothetical protein